LLFSLFSFLYAIVFSLFTFELFQIFTKLLTKIDIRGTV